MQEKFNQQSKLFSARLKKALECYPHSKGNLALRIGVSPVTISRWLGGRVPDHQYAGKLAAELSVRYSWLIFGTGEMKMPEMDDGVVSEYVPEYKVTRAITQSVQEAMVHAESDDLWEIAAHTMDGMVRLPAAMRLKIFDDLLDMVMEAKRKDEEKVSEL
jgi:hypothetical protein